MALPCVIFASFSSGTRFHVFIIVTLLLFFVCFFLDGFRLLMMLYELSASISIYQEYLGRGCTCVIGCSVSQRSGLDYAPSSDIPGDCLLL